MLFGKSLPISFVVAHHPDHRGVISALGVNDRGVIHASDTGIIFGLWDRGLAWYKGGVAGEMSSVTELRLQDFDISEDTGFVPSSPPLTSLPEYFTRWKLARTDQ